MIRKRNKEKSEGNSVQAEDNTKTYSEEEITTFREQAIVVLNILDSKGINIYDKSRTPGMYLRRNMFTPNKAEMDASQKVIDTLSSKRVNSKSAEKSEQIPSDLFSYFKNKKK